MGRLGSRLLLGLALLLSGGSAQADSPPPAQPQPDQPPAQQPPAQQPPSPDWLVLGVSFTAEPMVNPFGGASQQADWSGQTVIALSAGRGLNRPTDRWRELDHWSLNTSLTHTSGNVLYSEAIGALFPLQQIAYPSGFLLSEVSLTRDTGDGWLGVKAGILPLNPSFIATPAFDVYVHSAFNNTLNIGLNGLPISPYAAFGGVLTLQPRDNLSLRYGWFDLGSTQAVAQWLGGPAPWLNSLQGSLQLLQLDWSPPGWSAPANTPLSGCRTAAGVVRRRSGCRQPITVPNQLPAALLNLGGFRNGGAVAGVYGSATLRSGLPLGLDERIWLGGAWSDGGEATLTPSFLAAGLLVQAPLPQRPQDLLVLAGGRAGLTPERLGGWPSRYEAMVELGYQLQVSGNLALQPTLQWILNPSAGSRPLPSILATSLQITVNF